MIGVTNNHPFWSVSRQAFIPIGEMEVGERVQTRQGKTKRIVSKLARPDPESVYNLEIFGEHVYYVAKQQILVHNAYHGKVADQFRRTPNNLGEKLSMGGAGQRIMGEMSDPRFRGMNKMQHVHRNPSGTKTVIHYIFDPKTGQRLDFKFK